MKYMKKPLVIDGIQRTGALIVDAVQWTGDNLKEVFTFMNGGSTDVPFFEENVDSLIIATLEGDMKAEIGDYIIRVVEGELHLCKEDIFNKTYEKV